MAKKIKNLLITLATLLLTAVPAFAVAGVASAQTDQIQSGLCQGINTASDGSGAASTSCGPTGAGGDNSTITSILTTVVNILTLVVGIVAVIMIIIGGFRYITSGGDSSNISSAKNTIIYALVGLVIVALAQVIVHFVVNKAISAS